MKRKVIAFLPVAVAAGVLAGLAIAGSSTVPTTVSFDTVGTDSSAPPDRDFNLAGHVGSAKLKCLANRIVTITAGYDNETTSHPFDVARSGLHGGFAGFGPSKHNGNEIASARAVVKAKQIGTRQHPRKCGRAAIDAG
jgi:hypothetical protein